MRLRWHTGDPLRGPWEPLRGRGDPSKFCTVYFVYFILFSNSPVQHLILSFRNVANVICHVPQVDNSCAHLQRYQSHPIADDHQPHHLQHPDLVHVLLHLLLAVVLHPRLIRCCNEAVVWVQALVVETIRAFYSSCEVFWSDPAWYCRLGMATVETTFEEG